MGGKGGGSSYVRAHGHAARQAGFEPHVFCLAARSSEEGADFGVVHRVAVPALFERAALNLPSAWRGAGLLREWYHANVMSAYGAAFFARRLSAAVEAFLLTRRCPSVVHGFYTWGWVGVRARRRLRHRAPDPAVVMGAYTAAAPEVAAKAWAETSAGARARLVGGIERAWIRALVSPYEGRTYRQVDRVLVNYESVRRLLAAAHGRGAPVHRLPFATERAFLPPPARSPGHRQPALAPRIVSLSRHDPRKGLDVLLRALAELRAEGARFNACLVSGGPLLEHHRAVVSELGLGDVVELTGWVDDPSPYLESAEIFVLPSLHEGSGSIALLEAMQAGAAIVASAVDGIPEDVADGENGLLVPPGDVTALRRALALLLADPALRVRLGAAARETHRARFSPAAFAGALREQYEALLQR